MPPLVSLIIPYRNRERLLRRTLLSICAQAYRPLELILVDNGSTDASPAVCRTFAAEYAASDFAVVHLQEARRGASAARNRGAAAAAGEYLYFFDSDDELSPDFLPCVISRFQQTDADVVAAATRMVMPSGRMAVRRVCYTARVSDQILTAMLSTQSVVYRAERFRQLGGWNEQLPRWNDWELGVRLLLTSPRVSWLSGRAFHRIYQHTDSITGADFTHAYADLAKALDAVGQLVVQPADVMALYARTCLLAASLQREGSDARRRDCLVQARCRLRLLTPRRRLMAVCMGRILYAYARCGGRGGWWLARLLLCGIRL